MKRLSAPFFAVTLSLLSLLSGRSLALEKTAEDVSPKALATVNGVPITEYDLKQSLKRTAHGDKPTDQTTKTVLETIVRNELIYQNALELGLDKDAAYREKLREAEAQLRGFQRENMAALFRAYVKEKASVDEAEAKAYFEGNAERIRTRIRVWQITYKGEREKIEKDDEDLKKGVPFKDVASRRFANLPENVKAPWDVGNLHWSQLPPAWKNVVYDMKPGQTSGIIQGENGRFWIIHLLEKAIDPAISFETEKGRISEVLKRQKEEDLYNDLLGQFKQKSRVVFPK